MINLNEIEKNPNSINITNEELEQMVPKHTHTKSNIIIVIDGLAMVDIENTAFYIPFGYFVWIPAGVSHRVSFDDKKIKLLNIYFPNTNTDSDFYKQTGVYAISPIFNEAISLVAKQNNEYTEEDWQYGLLKTINNILPNISNNKFQIKLPTTNNPILIKILEEIHKNYQSKITATEISEKFGLSIRTLSRYFRNELNLSFYQYLKMYRMIVATKLLVNGKDNISGIAYSVGYDSITAFSNSFYKITGYRPSNLLDYKK